MRLHQDPFIQEFHKLSTPQSHLEELTSGSYWQMGALNMREN